LEKEEEAIEDDDRNKEDELEKLKASY